MDLIRLQKACRLRGSSGESGSMELTVPPLARDLFNWAIGTELTVSFDREKGQMILEKANGAAEAAEAKAS